MNRFINVARMIELGDPSWAAAEDAGLADLAVRYEDAPYYSLDGRRFINMCSCSYLGLDTHPKILEGAIDGIRRAGTLHLTTARVRMYTTLLREVEDALSDHFRCNAQAFVTCAAATSAYLPVLASGALTEGKKPVMVFDKFAHFSMGHIKPICGDETEVHTARHNDLQLVEDLCKKGQPVAYVADGTYSIAGHAPLKELLALQDRYGLFVFLDDSHGLSITGERGEGYVRERLPQLSDRTAVVASLAKAFGACGGILMTSGKRTQDVMARFGNVWSQYLNSAGLGGILGSLDVHRSPELAARQQAWQRNTDKLDDLVVTQNHRTTSPIRAVLLKTPDRAMKISSDLFDRGYYTSALFFPIVPNGTAGLRIMPRADVDADEMDKFCAVLKDVCGEDLIDADARQ